MNPLPKHFEQIQDLCRKVYPFSKPWSLAQLESHRSYFPDGQLIVIDKVSNRVVGLAFSLIILWNDYSQQDNWQDYTSGGFFHNHNPKSGKTLYGAEVMVDPELRGLGIGKLLYEARKKILDKYKLKRIRAGARLRGYSKFKDQFTPDEYVKQVVEKKIFDPTLSFQLNQGFKVIDVAQNYLFNDPESLGYAAVIEWLNPKESSSKDFAVQQQSFDNFMSGEKFVPQNLPRELRHLVRKATNALGQAILKSEGDELYKRIEFYREELKLVRNKQNSSRRLDSLLGKLKKEDNDKQLKLAHAFSLQLEVVNVCETAYRAWRQRHKNTIKIIKHKQVLDYVLTAHPTEARSRATIIILSQILKTLIDAIQNNLSFNEEILMTQMRMLWMQSLSKSVSPSVFDEAEYIFSLVFESDVLDFMLQENPGYEIHLRTWVGGDKDGHPGVDNVVMKKCLEGARSHIIDFILKKLSIVIGDMDLLFPTGKIKKSEVISLKEFQASASKLKNIQLSDGARIKTWKIKFSSFIKKSSPFVKDHAQIHLLLRLIDRFPAFVLPIELREDATKINESLTEKAAPIRLMLSDLSKFSQALKITDYAKGLIISHCETENSLSDACKLVDLTCKASTMPIIPLFESREALISSRVIVKNWLKEKRNLERVQRHWGNKFEVMLGYSDSAKQTGAFPSRLLIAESMQNVEKVLTSFKVKPIFFHGSGGSVARGGGSLKEQISWWSNSAIQSPKMTVQGEMIQRLFTAKEILNSQSTHFITESSRRKGNRTKFIKTEDFNLFADNVAKEYSKLVNDEKTLTKLLNLTPYKFFSYLKLGSRPSKRPSENITVDSLRAIPWILCWTQTRILWPVWWGLGSAWSSLSDEQKSQFISKAKTDPFFSSFVKTVGYTLAKVEIEIWRLYLKDENQLFNKFEVEFNLTSKFFLEVTQEKSFIWHRPWLEESIRLRSPHIHILNLLQIIAMNRSDELLLRETIVGIACGMLTTG